MPSFVIQRSTSSKSRALKQGNIVVGAEEANYGPTSTTGYYAGIDPPDGGFTLIRTVDNYPYFNTFDNDSDLIDFYNEITPVSTLSDVFIAVANNDEHLLVSSDPVDTDIEPYQEALNLSSNHTPQGKRHRLKGRRSNNKTQHGYEWVCMLGYTVDYVAIYPGTVINEINPSTGDLTLKVSSTSAPQTGTIPMTAGRIYTSNKPVHYLDRAEGAAVCPLSYKGRLFGFYYSRYNPQTIYIFATEDNTNVKFWRGSIGGTLIQEYNLNANTLQSFSGNYAGDYYHFQSNKPVCITSNASGDKIILPQASTNYSYRRYNEYERCIDGGAPSLNGSYVIKDDVPCWAISIADGSGGEAESSMPLDYLTDTYAFGSGELRSYFIVSPYTNTITVSYYSGGTWVEYDSHIENGTLSSPSVHAEGAQNGGTALVSGLGTVPWKFEGTNPFYIVINDGSADEEALFGWNRNEKVLSIVY